MVTSIFYMQVAKACNVLADKGVQEWQVGPWLDTQEMLNGSKDAATKAKPICKAVLWHGFSLGDVSRDFGVSKDAAARVVLREARRWGAI